MGQHWSWASSPVLGSSEVVSESLSLVPLDTAGMSNLLKASAGVVARSTGCQRIRDLGQNELV